MASACTNAPSRDSAQAQICLEIRCIQLLNKCCHLPNSRNRLHHWKIHSSSYTLHFERWQSDQGWPSYSEMKIGENMVWRAVHFWFYVVLCISATSYIYVPCPCGAVRCGAVRCGAGGFGYERELFKTKETNNGIVTCMWCSHSVLVRIMVSFPKTQRILWPMAHFSITIIVEPKV